MQNIGIKLALHTYNFVFLYIPRDCLQSTIKRLFPPMLSRRLSDITDNDIIMAYTLPVLMESKMKYGGLPFPSYFT